METNLFGDAVLGAATLFSGVGYSQDAPGLAPKATKFQGYSKGRFDQIKFQIDFDDLPLNIRSVVASRVCSVLEGLNELCS